MRKRMSVLVVAVLTAASMSLSAGVALADSPFAGNSGHFKGSSNPCQNGNSPKCPPFGR